MISEEKEHQKSLFSWQSLSEGACAILQKFKTNYLSDKESHVGQGNLNKRKRRTLLREDQILDIVREFSHLEGTFTFELNFDLICVDFARRIGTVGKEPEDLLSVKRVFNLWKCFCKFKMNKKLILDIIRILKLK